MSLRAGSAFAHKITLVFKSSNSLTNGKTPKIMSTPELSAKIAAHTYGSP